MKDKIEAGEPAIGFSIDCKINDRRAIVMQSYLPISAGKEQINELLDRLMNAAHRQENVHRLRDMKVLLEKAEQELPLHEKKLVSFEEETIRAHEGSGRKSDFKWAGNAKSNRDNLIQSVAMTRVNIDKIKKAIAEAEAEIEKG